MQLNEIVDQIFDIATATEYNNISYSHPLLVSTGKKPHPSDLLTSIAAPLKLKITNSTPISKTEISAALEDLKKVDKKYKIKELKELIKDLKIYLDSLG